MAWLALVSAGLSAAGSIQAGNAAAAAGKAEQQEKNFEAQQYQQNAGQEIAASQRAAFDEDRRTRLIASRALAVGAATGGANDPTVVKLISDINGEGAYRAAMATYRGDEAARKSNLAAEGARYSGEIAALGGQQRQQAMDTQAIGGLAKSGGSLYQNYGGGGPSSQLDEY